MGHTDESTLGVIHKVRALRFRNFKPSLPLCTCTYAFSLHPLPPLWHVYFANYYQSKNHKQRYKIKKILFKAIGECQIKIPKRARGSSLHFLTVQRRWKWIILAMWIAHFVLFLLCNEPSKKIYDVPALTA